MTGGSGIDLAPEDVEVLLRSGLSVAITGSLMVQAQYLQCFVADGGNLKDQVTVSANVHF